MSGFGGWRKYFLFGIISLSAPLSAFEAWYEDDCGRAIAQYHGNIPGAIVRRLENVLAGGFEMEAGQIAASIASLDRRLAYVNALEANHLNTLPMAFQRRLLGQIDIFLLGVELVEMMPASRDPSRSVGPDLPLGSFSSHWGLPYLLDVLSMPASAALAYVRTNLSPNQAMPVVVLEQGASRPLPPALAQAKSRAMETARRKGWRYLIVNRNGSFSPVEREPKCGDVHYVDLEGNSYRPGFNPRSLEAQLLREQSADLKYFVVEPRTGNLVRSDREPTARRTEYLIMDATGSVIDSRVTADGVSNHRNVAVNENVLVEALKNGQGLENIAGVVHDQAFWLILERLSQDLGYPQEEMAYGRARALERLIGFNSQYESPKLGEVVIEILIQEDPLRSLKSFSEIEAFLAEHG